MTQHRSTQNHSGTPRRSTGTTIASENSQQMHSTKKVGFIGLFALVISAMVGGGVFSLPQNMAQHAAIGGQLIAWLITGIGMWFIVDTFRVLTAVEPTLKDGLYSYARHGFGRFVGFLVAYGYWICNCFSLIAYGVLIMSTMDIFFPGTFSNGNNLLSVVGASAILWIMVAIALCGTSTGALINVIGTICKIVPVIIFVFCMIFLFHGSIALHDLWGISNTGIPLSFDWGRIGSQVSDSMLVTLWLFIGIEGAVVISGSARSARDVSRATTGGYLAVLILYILVSVLPLGVYNANTVAGMPNPSMSVIMEQQFGQWGAVLVNIGVIISVLFAWLVWMIMISQMPLFAARDEIFPRSFLQQNRYGAPRIGLLWTGIICQLLFVLCYFVHGDAWEVMISITSVMAMPCYLLCCLYLWKIALRKPHLFAKDLCTRRHAFITSILGSLFSLFLVYSAGLQYLMVACAIFAVGLPLYVVANRQSGSHQMWSQMMSPKERILFSCIVIVGCLGMIYTIHGGLFSGA